MINNKRYAILHIESGQYLSSMENKLKNKGILWVVVLPKLFTYETCNVIGFENYGIIRKDFQINNYNLLFRDKVSAITFLRDAYLPTINQTIIRNIKYSRTLVRQELIVRNEFEIVEL
jgi:hypothetical protein